MFIVLWYVKVLFVVIGLKREGHPLLSFSVIKYSSCDSSSEKEPIKLTEDVTHERQETI